MKFFTFLQPNIFLSRISESSILSQQPDNVFKNGSGLFYVLAAA